jgi:Fe-S cluster biogenesis protein NfuA
MTSDDDRLHRQVGRVEELLTQLESYRDEPAGALAVQAVQALVDLYGNALTRVVALATDAGLISALTDDGLLEHLLLVHDLHPEDMASRVRRALGEVMPYLREHGADAEVMDISADLVRVRLDATGCSSTTRALTAAVTDAVRGAAPEVERVEVVEPRTAPVLIPLTAVRAAAPVPGS